MLIEMRTYVLHAGKMAAFLDAMEKEGIAIERPILGRLLGFYSSEIGTLNQVITMWGYADMAEREEKRARLYADPAWIAFAPKTTHLIQTMQTEILRPTSFSPIR